MQRHTTCALPSNSGQSVRRAHLRRSSLKNSISLHEAQPSAEWRCASTLGRHLGHTKESIVPAAGRCSDLHSVLSRCFLHNDTGQCLQLEDVLLVQPASQHLSLDVEQMGGTGGQLFGSGCGCRQEREREREKISKIRKSKKSKIEKSK